MATQPYPTMEYLIMNVRTSLYAAAAISVGLGVACFWGGVAILRHR